MRGNFPKEFPISSSEASNGFGQWLSPEDAERITKAHNSIQAPYQRINETQQHPDQFLPYGEAELLSDTEDEDLKAAIAASLMDSCPAVASAETRNPQSDNQISKQVATMETMTPPNDLCNNKQVTATEASSHVHDQTNLEVASAASSNPQVENQNCKEKTV